jgi:hypothetical protein
VGGGLAATGRFARPRPAACPVLSPQHPRRNSQFPPLIWRTKLGSFGRIDVLDQMSVFGPHRFTGFPIFSPVGAGVCLVSPPRLLTQHACIKRLTSDASRKHALPPFPNSQLPVPSSGRAIRRRNRHIFAIHKRTSMLFTGELRRADRSPGPHAQYPPATPPTSAFAAMKLDLGIGSWVVGERREWDQVGWDLRVWQPHAQYPPATPPTSASAAMKLGTLLADLHQIFMQRTLIYCWFEVAS